MTAYWLNPSAFPLIVCLSCGGPMRNAIYANGWVSCTHCGVAFGSDESVGPGKVKLADRENQ